MKNKSYFVFSNGGGLNDDIERRIDERMLNAGFSKAEAGSDDGIDLIYCIGGDGALLRLLRSMGFPDAPIVGINTGHLGFFQEIPIEGIDDFFAKLENGDYTIQNYIGISVDIYGKDGFIKSCEAINEVVIRGDGERLMHMGMKIGHREITRFSGDGVLICTPAGSTAYNYSLGGAIVDPSVDMLQITPMAPVNNSAYRSLSTSIIMPTRTSIELYPDGPKKGETPKNVVIIEDGGIVADGCITKIVVRVSDKPARIVRFSSYNFWDKVRDKIIG